MKSKSAVLQLSFICKLNTIRETCIHAMATGMWNVMTLYSINVPRLQHFSKFCSPHNCGLGSASEKNFYEFFFTPSILGIEPRALGMLGKCPTTELYFRPLFFSFFPPSIIWRQSLAKFPMLASKWNPPNSASQLAGIIGMCYHNELPIGLRRQSEAAAMLCVQKVNVKQGTVTDTGLLVHLH